VALGGERGDDAIPPQAVGDGRSKPVLKASAHAEVTSHWRGEREGGQINLGACPAGGGVQNRRVATDSATSITATRSATAKASPWSWVT